MKEKIAESLKTQGFFQRENYCKVTHEEQARFILTLITQEIEKVEVEFNGTDHESGVESCRQAILNLFKEEQ